MDTIGFDESNSNGKMYLNAKERVGDCRESAKNRTNPKKKDYDDVMKSRSAMIIKTNIDTREFKVSFFLKPNQI